MRKTILSQLSSKSAFAVEKSLDRKFGSVTDQYILRLLFIDGNFSVSVRSDAEIIVLKQIIGKFLFLFLYHYHG